jgi:hypothetical protein
MSDDLIKAEPREVDGYEGYEDGYEGGEQPQSHAIIQGACVKFTNDAAWELRDGEELPPDLELVAIDIARIVQRWKDQQPIETRILEPGQKFPDIVKLNEEVPQSEWTEGPDGKLRGPWQAQHVVYLLNPATMDRYTFPTGTVGGSIAVRDLVDKTTWMRKFRGNRVYPVVTLSDTFMPTRFGGRQRPHFLIKRWVGLGSAGAEALPAPPPYPPQDRQFRPAVASPSALSGAQEVEPPSLKEEMDDEVPFSDALPDFGIEAASKKK